MGKARLAVDIIANARKQDVGQRQRVYPVFACAENCMNAVANVATAAALRNLVNPERDSAWMPRMRCHCCAVPSSFVLRLERLDLASPTEADSMRSPARSWSACRLHARMGFSSCAAKINSRHTAGRSSQRGLT